MNSLIEIRPRLPDMRNGVRNILLQSEMPAKPQVESEKSEWDWYPADFTVMDTLDSDVTLWSLKPTARLTDPQNISQIIDVDLEISMDKAFENNPAIGWTWHKSWIIPTISVHVNLKRQDETPLSHYFPQQLTVKVMALKAGTKSSDKFFLLDVGLQGQSTKVAQPEGVNFQGLKFLQTSYKNENSKFNLVVALGIALPNKKHLLIVASKISPPIFVDSRRTARETTCGNKLYEVFNPQLFNRILVKKTKSEDLEITDSAQGFYSYLTAPNIRNKIKNPFFLAYRFSKFVKLYYRSQAVGRREELIEKCMARFTKAHHSTKMPKNKHQKKNQHRIHSQPLVSPILYLALCFHTLPPSTVITLDRIVDKFGHYDNRVLEIVKFEDLNQQQYVLFENIEQIKNLYIQYYVSLQKYEGQILKTTTLCRDDHEADITPSSQKKLKHGSIQEENESLQELSLSEYGNLVKKEQMNVKQEKLGSKIPKTPKTLEANISHISQDKCEVSKKNHFIAISNSVSNSGNNRPLHKHQELASNFPNPSQNNHTPIKIESTQSKFQYIQPDLQPNPLIPFLNSPVAPNHFGYDPMLDMLQSYYFKNVLKAQQFFVFDQTLSNYISTLVPPTQNRSAQSQIKKQFHESSGHKDQNRRI